MKSLIDNISYLSKILGTPISAETISAQAVTTEQAQFDYKSLSDVLTFHGLENKLLKRELDDISSLAMPALILLKDKESAVITKIEGVGNERVYYLSQSDDITQTITAETLKQFYIGYCWFIKPKVTSDQRSELPEYHLPKAWFWKVIWRFKHYYTQVILATFIINFLALVSSLYVMNVYDRVIPNKTYETLWVLSIGVVLAIGFEFIAKLIRSHLTDIAGKKADLIISSALFRRIMAIKLSDKPASSGSYANNLRDFEAVREFMTSVSLLVLVDFPFLLLFIFVIWLLGGYLAIVPTIIIPLVIIIGLITQPKLAQYINESMRESSQRQGLAVEALDGIETLKTNNATNWAQQRWEKYTAIISASQIKSKDLSNFIIYFSVAMQQLNTVFLVLLGTYLIHHENEAERITMGALIAAVILSGRALAPLSQIAGLATRFQQARLALNGINSIIERPIERAANKNYISLDDVVGQIRFENVSFQYNKDEKPVLNQFNVTINPKEKVGILGKIGSGKSTILKLASGLYENSIGNITLDNVDIRQIDPNYLRDRVLLLEQSPHLFLGSLRDNMNMARTDKFYSDQALLASLFRFGLRQMIQNHPRGIDMSLGENGLGLSGGQKQLVALARMTLKDPKVVLLDEPTHSLDMNTEEQALRVLADWTKEKTLIVVTHRPQVLKIVDRIIVIDNGNLVMDGPRDAVLKRLSQNEE